MSLKLMKWYVIAGSHKNPAWDLSDGRNMHAPLWRCSGTI